MRVLSLPLLSLLAACAGAAAAVESAPATASAAADPLACAQHFLGSGYQRESGSVEAGFIRFNTYRQRGGMMTVPYDSTLLTVTRTNGALRVDAPLHAQSTVRSMLAACNPPAPAPAASGSAGE